MGGLVAADAVASGACQVEGLVLSSPALALHLSGLQKALLASLPRLLPNLRVHNGVDSRHLSHDPAVVQAYDRDPLQHPRISGRMARYMAEGGARVVARAPAWRTPPCCCGPGRTGWWTRRAVPPWPAWRRQRCCRPSVLGRRSTRSSTSEALAAPVFTRLQQWLDQQFPPR
jgi:alpha-beta hydrolase superfamily lysophospholipase